MARQPFRMLIVLLAASVLMPLAACGGKQPPATPAPPPPPPPPQVTQTPPPPPPPPPAPAPAPTPPPAPTAEELFARKTVQQLNDEHPLDDVFFAFDKSDLSDTARASLQKDADWMRKWTTTTVTIEGHADDRGTNEYNLALGERRASAVRDYLVSLGVPGSRLTVVSKGEEEPFCHEENETCWSQNRRGHFIITAK